MVNKTLILTVILQYQKIYVLGKARTDHIQPKKCLLLTKPPFPST
jgi:hypothetical protein